MTREEEVSALREALKQGPREHDPLAWATTQNDFGNALACLGEHGVDTAPLIEAVAAYRAALQIWTRERAPLQWAMAESNLGRALLRLGEREAGTARLEEVIARADVVLAALPDAAADRSVAACRTNRDRASLLLAMRRGEHRGDLVADVYLYPTERSGRRGSIMSGYQCLCLTKDESRQAWRCVIDVGPQPMRPGERRQVRFTFELGATAAASLRTAKTFYLRELGILGEATVAEKLAGE